MGPRRKCSPTGHQRHLHWRHVTTEGPGEVGGGGGGGALRRVEQTTSTNGEGLHVVAGPMKWNASDCQVNV